MQAGSNLLPVLLLCSLCPTTHIFSLFSAPLMFAGSNMVFTCHTKKLLSAECCAMKHTQIALQAVHWVFTDNQRQLQYIVYTIHCLRAIYTPRSPRNGGLAFLGYKPHQLPAITEVNSFPYCRSIACVQRTSYVLGDAGSNHVPC